MTRVFPSLHHAALVVLLCFGTVLHSGADSVTLFPSADATLIERDPSNSIGAASWISAGTTQNGNSNRALLKFDVAEAIPAGSTITGVGLNLWVTRTPADGNNDSVFSLRRVLRYWGEGFNADPPSSPGFGLPAQPGDATWLYCFSDTNAWSIPGGLEGADYSAAISASAFIAGVSTQPYFFEAGDLIADVQLWLDNPQANFGWMLKTEDETSRFTARRFGSRELADPSASPQLTIDFLPPLRISSIQTASNQITLTFSADAGYSYRVEARDALAETNSWIVLTNYGLVLISEPRTATDLLNGAQRFYRVRRN
jgi:hypothetical protein